jgi:DNA gyrase/topoisomerase IV subunit B
VFVAHAPLAALWSPTLESPTYVYHEPDYRSAAQALREAGHEVHAVRYRGLAGVDLGTLKATCVDPATRTVHALGRPDADAMLRVLGRGEPQPTLF